MPCPVHGSISICVLWRCLADPLWPMTSQAESARRKMRGEMLRTILTAGLCVSAGCLLAANVTADDIAARARKLHFSSIVVDTHDDTTQRFLDGKFDLGPRDANGSIDIPRMKEGGLGAIFFSI